MMLLRQIFDPDTWTYTYLLADVASGQAALIDPVRDQIDRDLRLLNELDLKLAYVFDTHVHADHITAAGVLRDKTGCQTVVSETGPESADLRLRQDATVRIGTVTIRAIATPGHTDDSMSFAVDGHVFTGDTLLVRGCGRSDFQNGDARALYDSITTKLFTLPDETVVWPGHDYRGQTCSTIGEEKRHNPRLAGKSREAFIATMNSLGLPPPKHLHAAVPANQELGLGTELSDSPSTVKEYELDGTVALSAFDRIVDVRESHEFNGELGHLPGAENIPRAQLAAAAKGWSHSERLLIVCRSGRRSRAVCSELVGNGFSSVSNLRGGMLSLRERRGLSG